MRAKEKIERKLKNFLKNDVPKIITNNKECYFVQNAIATIYETNSCYAIDIARHIDNGTKIKSKEKLVLKRLEDMNKFLLDELLCKDAIRHFKNKKFYIAIDVTPIEKAFAKYEKSPVDESPMEGLSIVHDNAKKDGSKLVKGYDLFTVVGITKNGKSTFILGAAILNRKISISQNLIMKSLLFPIFKELEKQKKKPISILGDSGYDISFLFNFFNQMNLNFTIKYHNIRHFNIIVDGKVKRNLTLSDLYQQTRNCNYIKFNKYDGEIKQGLLKYTTCRINNFDKPINVVMFNCKGNISALLTTNKVKSYEDAKYTIYRYTRRWCIELMFAFLKKYFKLEKYLVQTLKKMSNLLLLIMITSNFYAKIWHMKSKLKEEIIKNLETLTCPKFGLETIILAIKKLYQPNISIP